MSRRAHRLGDEVAQPRLLVARGTHQAAADARGHDLASAVDQVLEELLGRPPARVDRTDQVDHERGGDLGAGQAREQRAARVGQALRLERPVAIEHLGVACGAQRGLGAEVVRDQARGHTGAPRDGAERGVEPLLGEAADRRLADPRARGEVRLRTPRRRRCSHDQQAIRVTSLGEEAVAPGIHGPTRTGPEEVGPVRVALLIRLRELRGTPARSPGGARDPPARAAPSTERCPWRSRCQGSRAPVAARRRRASAPGRPSGRRRCR